MKSQAGDPSPTDAELVARTLDGDKTAFDEVIRRYQRQAVAVAFRLLGNSHDALEVTQDAFLKAYASLHTLQAPAALGGWMMRIVSNLSLNYRRSRQSRNAVLPLDDLLGEPPGSSGSGPAADDPLRILAGRELGARLQEALAQLPEKQRTAIIMFTIEEMPQKDIAVALDCSVEAIKWHVFQGRKRLKEILKDYV